MSYILNYSNNDLEATGGSGYIININGKNHIDTSLGNGTHILGHAQRLEFKNGTLYGSLKTYNVDDYCDMLESLTGWERFVICSTGAEATMRAARIARAYTKRTKIAMFRGGWHGGCDTWIDSLGVPIEVKSLCTRLPMTMDGIDALTREYALVMIEPVQGSLPRDIKDFLKKLRKKCYECGILLGFDEVTTGFRLAKGGAREYYGIEPDIVTYGKIAGGGLPIGIVSGQSHIMEIVKEGVRLGGTFSCNPLTLSTGLALLSKLNDDVYKYLNTQGQRLRDELIMPVTGVGSINRILFTDKEVKNKDERDKYEDIKLKDKFVKKALNNEVYIGSNGILFLSTKHTPEVVTALIDRLNEAWKKASRS